VRAALEEQAAAVLVRHPRVRRVILFGSMQRGNYAPGSDADVAILLDGDDERVWFQRILDFSAEFDGVGVGVDLFPYTEREFREALAEGNDFFHEIARGDVLAQRSR